MKISESRALLRSTAANAGDKTSFSDDALDNTTRMIGNDLAKRADATLITTAIVLSQGSDALPVIHADFRAERLRHEPYLTGSNVTAGGRLRQPRRTGDKTGQVEVWDYLDLNDWALRGGGTQAGQPEAIAFPSSAAVGRCYPVPDDDYTLNIPWVPPFLAWYPGVALALATVSGGAVTAIQVISGGANYLSAPSVSFSGGGGSGATATAAVSAGRVTGFTVGAGGTGYTAAPSVLLNTQLADDQTLNIPADYLEEALMSGGCAALQFNDLKRRFGSANWQRYESFVARLAGQARPARRIQRVSRW